MTGVGERLGGNKRILFHYSFYGVCTRIGILLPKLFWPTVRKNWSCDKEFEKFMKSLEQVMYSNNERSEKIILYYLPKSEFQTQLVNMNPIWTKWVNLAPPSLAKLLNVGLSANDKEPPWKKKKILLIIKY